MWKDYNRGKSKGKALINEIKTIFTTKLLSVTSTSTSTSDIKIRGRSLFYLLKFTDSQRIDKDQL